MVHDRDLLRLVSLRTGSRSLSDLGVTIWDALWWALHGMSMQSRKRRGLPKQRGDVAHGLASRFNDPCDRILGGERVIPGPFCLALG